ncbi:MFS transporter [Deinococcus maricopensis]|uniref:Major facilitator superfamily MFS_1 n=1 Tax=Deinococcus maricopensis (strain DSM 21211 / LMG 22137 / NRRL B-23946 / LB-34) TaxID=709986 RepID=E8U494_DEIML|nr:MFS transporter [Deinococcus maricopensis]ADV65931.1 major facilitator superfamily MFS_1 [Deinococcus maricopensis DSM 21211]
MTALPSSTSAPPRTLTVGLLLTIVAVAFESMAVATVLPRVADDLHGLALYGWASGAFLLTSLFGAVISGTLTDRRGPAVAAGAGVLVFTAGLVVAGFAPSMAVFVLGRAVQGLGAGGLGALPFAVIRARYPEQARARMLAAVSSAWLLPALVGPLLASLLADTLTWRAVFWGLAPVMLLVGPLCVLPLRGTVPDADRGASGAGVGMALLLVVGAGALIEGLRTPGAYAWALLALGAVGVLVATRHLFPRGLWRFAPGLPAALMVRGFAAFAVLGANATLPLALHELRGLTLTQAGWLLSVGGVTWSLGSLVQSRLEARFGAPSRPLRIRAGMGLVTVALVITTLGVLGPLPVSAAYVGWLLSGLGMGVGYNSNSLLALSSVDDRQAGTLSGQLANIEVLMSAISAGLAGALIARVTPLPHAFLGAFAALIIGSLLTWVAAARLRR